MVELQEGCVKPARGPFVPTPQLDIPQVQTLPRQEVGKMTARVDHEATDFELIRQIKAFQHVRATAEVTPTSWQPGQVTLKPGPDLVGRVWKLWKT